MIKAIQNTSEGPIVYLGFTPANMQLLRQDNPILFPMSELGIGNGRYIVVLWDSPSFRKEMRNLQDCHVVFFVLDDVAIERMRGMYGVVCEDVVYILFLRDNLNELKDVIAQGITDATTVIGPEQYDAWKVAQQ